MWLPYMRASDVDEDHTLLLCARRARLKVKTRTTLGSGARVEGASK